MRRAYSSRVRSLGKGVAAVLVLLVAVALVSSAGARTVRKVHALPLATSATITLSATPTQVVSGVPVTLLGQVNGATPGTSVDLYRSPYPYTASDYLRSAPVSSSGAYSFTDIPDRSTRYSVVLHGTTTEAQAQVGVSPRVVIKVKPRPLGLARVTIVIFHPRDLHWGKAKVRWSFATGRRGPFSRSPRPGRAT